MVVPDKIFITTEELEVDCSKLAKQMYDTGYRPDIVAGVWRGGAHAAAYVTGALKRLGADHTHFPVTGKSYEKGVGNRSTLIRVYNMGDLTRYARAFRLKKICFADDVLDSTVTGHSLSTVAVNGLRRRDADKAFVVRDGKAKALEPKDAIKLGPRSYTLYNFEIRADGTTYTIQMPMITDIIPFDAEVTIAAPYQKSYANLTGLKPDFCIRDYPMNDGKPIWLNFPYELEKEDISDEEMMLQRPGVAEVLLDRAA
ncbi:MAG: hypothetical protein WC613_00260 [Candidatus Aenigmatarchaeota archaeon]